MHHILQYIFKYTNHLYMFFPVYSSICSWTSRGMAESSGPNAESSTACLDETQSPMI